MAGAWQGEVHIRGSIYQTMIGSPVKILRRKELNTDMDSIGGPLTDVTFRYRHARSSVARRLGTSGHGN